MPLELEISTSPRSTWVWAPDDQTAEAVRSVLRLAGQAGHPAVGRNAESRITDIDIGVVALEALEALLAEAYTFRWHTDQHPLNQRENLYGVLVAPASASDPSQSRD